MSGMNLNELRAQRAMERKMEAEKEQIGNISHSGSLFFCDLYRNMNDIFKNVRAARAL